MRIGVIGVGSLGYHHARILASMEEVALAGVHDTDGRRLAEVTSQLGVAGAESTDALLAACDAVVIAVPTAFHEDVALTAIAAGVHILIEKPIAPTLESADRILAAAESAGVLVQIGHVERFNSAVRACEAYIDEPLFVESHRLAPFAIRGTDVAVVLDLMIHDLDLVLSIMGRPVRGLAAVGVPVLTASVDIANARLEFEGGAVANLTASRVSLERLRKLRLFQRSGYISLDLAAGTGEYLRLRPGVALDMLAGLRGGDGAVQPRLEDYVERVTLAGDGVEPLRRELECFADAVSGERPVTVSGRQGRAALAVALEIVQGIRHNVAVAHTS